MSRARQLARSSGNLAREMWAVNAQEEGEELPSQQAVAWAGRAELQPAAGLPAGAPTSVQAPARSMIPTPVLPGYQSEGGTAAEAPAAGRQAPSGSAGTTADVDKAEETRLKNRLAQRRFRHAAACGWPGATRRAAAAKLATSACQQPATACAGGAAARTSLAPRRNPP